MVLSLQSFDDDKDNGDDDFDDDFFKHSFFFHISIVFKIRLQKYAQKLSGTNKKGNLNTKWADFTFMLSNFDSLHIIPAPFRFRFI